LAASKERFESHSKYLQDTNSGSKRIPAFYGLIKMHKNPISLRPIIACHSWITTPVSRVCAYELYLLIRRHLPHVLRDSSHLVKLIESCEIPKEFPTTSFRLITGDVEGLYVNIPIEEAIVAVTKFVADHTSNEFAILINGWLRFVFEEAFVQFGQRTFRQTWGFPMGTALSPDAANIFMALCEDVQGVYQHATLSALLPNTKCLLIFTRLIDDYTIILAGVDDTSTLAFLHELDRRVQPYLQITWQVSVKAMNTLYLHIYLPENFRNTGKFVYRTHQKPGNRYTFLPFTSLHPIWTKIAIVNAEITRHATNCSTESWFRHMSNLYFIRQLHRGFPANFF
jgi:hypothetical protein